MYCTCVSITTNPFEDEGVPLFFCHLRIHSLSYFLSFCTLHVVKTILEISNYVYGSIFNFCHFNYLSLIPFCLSWKAAAKDSWISLGHCFLKCYLCSYRDMKISIYIMCDLCCIALWIIVRAVVLKNINLGYGFLFYFVLKFQPCNVPTFFWMNQDCRKPTGNLSYLSTIVNMLTVLSCGHVAVIKLC